MKKRKKIILWTVYFDSSKRRREGRKIPKNIAVQNPTLKELHIASMDLGLDPELESNISHPAAPWEKSGRILVSIKDSKLQTIKDISKRIQTNRQKTRKK